MAMLTIKKLIGFLMVFILYTINPTLPFPTAETTKIKQYDEITPIRAVVSVNGLEQVEVLFALFMPLDDLRYAGCFRYKVKCKRYFFHLIISLHSSQRLILSMVFSASFCPDLWFVSSLFPFLTRHEGVG